MGEVQETTETRRIGWILTMLGQLPPDHPVRTKLLPVVYAMVKARRRLERPTAPPPSAGERG